MNSSKRPGATAKPPATRRPGAWLTAALTSGGGLVETDIGEGTKGDHQRRSDIQTVSVGVQWEEGEGEAVALPSSSTSTRGGLPPWAKPYTCPPKGAVGDDGGSGSDTSAFATVESRGIQCGEPMLGG